MPWFITVIVGLACFLGGIFTESGIEHNRPPKTQIINQTQIQNTENRNIQSSEQAQITVVTAKTNININISARTNFNFSSHTNKQAKTNVVKETPPKSIKIPILH